MARYDFTVDTSPMAQTVDAVRGHVNGVTVAVTAMETAVITAEQTASKTICENVDKGFYTLMKSQLSQKAVAAYTEMRSKEVVLLQLAKALDNVRNQMQGDYNMICRRYHKLFQSLNKALETRIRELDRPAMNIAETKKSLVFDRMKNDSSLVFNVSEDTLSASQTAASGKLKQKTSDTIKTLYESTVENRSYNEKLKSILFKESDEAGSRSIPEKDDCYFLPVIFSSVESFLNGSDVIENIYVAQTDKWQNSGSIITEVGRIQNSFNWTSLNPDEKEIIKKEFVRLCEEDNPDDRTGREAVRLFEENSWEVLKNEL
jgi:hypothetical protein